ncbi:MAG: hypothetical protein IJ650_06930 [Paludibacteraceae bacterium]|nr:hypothetical protein [Paludibacteraceae bacterium]
MTKKQHIILWSVLGGVAILLSVIISSADVIVTKIADRQLRNVLSKTDKVEVTYDKLHVLLMSGTVGLDNVTCRIPMQDSLTGVKAEQLIKIEDVDIRGINWFRLRKKQLKILSVRLKSPEAQLVLPPKELKKKKDTTQPADSSVQRLPDSPAHQFTVSIDRVRVKNASVSLTRLGDKFALHADSITVKANDLSYDVATKQLAYNDSVYSLSLGNFSMLSADGLFELLIKELDTKDAGKINIEGLRAHNTCKPAALSKAKGKLAVTWVDASIMKLTTSSVNVIRQARNKSVNIDSIAITGKRVEIYRDTQFPPKTPYGMPQEGIMKIPMPVEVGTIKVSLPQFDVALTRDGNHVGKLTLDHLHLNAASFNNKQGNTLKAHLTGKLGEGGADMNLTLRNDKACTFTFNFLGKDVSTEQLNSFVHPISGASISANIHSVEIKTKGDKQFNKGTFCMLYDELTAHITKEDAPIERLAKNAGVINFFAPAIIQKQNPRSHNHEPFTPEINIARDPQKNFASYLMSPFMDGVMHTVFPDYIYQSIMKSISQKKAQEKK